MYSSKTVLSFTDSLGPWPTSFLIEDLIRCKIIGKREEPRRGREGWSLYKSLLILIHLDYKRLVIDPEYQWC